MIKGQDMTPDEVNELVTRVKKENREVEFKTTTAEIHKACRTLCAFLNGRGGIVLIGVKNNGHPMGQMVTDPTCQEIANDIRKIEPPAPVEVSYIPLGEKFVIAMEVPGANHMPYIFDGRPYHRVENETVVMPQHLYEQLLVKRGQLNHSWEEFISDQYSVDDLDHDEIYKMVKHGIEAGRVPDNARNESVSDILSSLELIKNNKLINAAMVLFAKKVTPAYPQCMIKMARFRGLSETEDFLDNQQFHGNAFKIMEEANAFMRKHLSIAGFYQADSFVRVDKPTLPVLVVREAFNQCNLP
jgi:ATP-dependent DNA helicase RecG